MIDFLIGLIVGAAGAAAYFHFKGETPAKALSEISNLEGRIQMALSQALQDAMAAITAAADAKAAKAVEDYKAANPPVDVQAAVDAQAAEDAAAVHALAATL